MENDLGYACVLAKAHACLSFEKWREKLFDNAYNGNSTVPTRKPLTNQLRICHWAHLCPTEMSETAQISDKNTESTSTRAGLARSWKKKCRVCRVVVSRVLRTTSQRHDARSEPSTAGYGRSAIGR